MFSNRKKEMQSTSEAPSATTGTRTARPTWRRSRRLRLLAATVAATGGLAGAGLVASATTAGAMPNICVVAADNAAYYMAEYEDVLPDSGYQPSLTEVHLGLDYLHLAQMWRSYGRGFGC